MAAMTVLTLATSLGVLYGLTDLLGQTFTVALLGVVISMISSMAFSDPRRWQQAETAGLMLVIAAVAVSLGAVLAPHKLAGDVTFVVIMTVATAARRFGPRATTLGMVGFMTYFFALFLGATVSLLPWLIGALAVGTGVSLGIHLVLREDPDAQVRRAMGALRASVALVVDVVADGVAFGRCSEPDRLRRRMARVSRAALMIDGELQDLHVSNGADRLALLVFDVELANEHLAGVWNRVTASPVSPSATDPGHARAEVLAALSALGAGLRPGAPPAVLAAVEATGDAIAAGGGPVRWQMLQLAVAQLAGTVARVTPAPTGDDRTEIDGRTDVDDGGEAGEEKMAGCDAGSQLARPGHDESGSGERTDDPAGGSTYGVPADGSATGDLTTGGMVPDGSWVERLAPSTRQAVQVAVASSLAIVAGTQLSSARWYWAVIAAFTIYSGTTSRGETFTRGGQRVAGTVAGVAVGAVIASLVAGQVTVSIALIFVALFVGFYLMRVSYAFMVLGMTTMLALLYGLLGEFTIGLLVTRIEETAIGAGIGIIVALFVAPTTTRSIVQRDLRYVLDGLAELLDRTARHLDSPGDDSDELTRSGRELDTRLQTLRANAKPLTSGITSLRTRNTVAEGVRILAACDHYARGLTRVVSASGLDADSQLAAVVDHVHNNVVVLAGTVGSAGRRDICPAGPLLDAAQLSVDAPLLSVGERQARRLAVRYLTQLELAVIDLAAHLHSAGEGAPPAAVGADPAGHGGRMAGDTDLA